MQRRDFIVGLGGAAAVWPLATRAQQRKVPVIGYLNVASPEGIGSYLAAMRKGLSDTGYVEGANLAIEYRWANDDYNRLPELAADLVRRQVGVIVAEPISPALAAKAATTTIPIVFFAGGDAVEAGLVTSLNRPGGNVTGINSMNTELGPKRLGLLHDLLPKAMRFGLLVHPNVPNIDLAISRMQAAAAVIGRPIEILSSRTPREIDTAFASLVQKRVDALVLTPHLMFSNRRVQLSTLAVRYAVPAIFTERMFTEVGGLMSYSASDVELHRQFGVYVGRILKGEKPSELPVMQPTKFEFIINLQTARTLGIEVPPQLLAITDEVID
jgi:putative ABC transport system substrate-binding protein